MTRPVSSGNYPRLPSIFALVAVATCLIACSDGSDRNPDQAPPEAPDPIILTAIGLPGSAPAGEALADQLVIVASAPDGSPMADVMVEVAVAAGGGSITPRQATTDGTGQAVFEWVLGTAPVRNRVQASAGVDSADLEVTATLAAPWVPEGFVDVDAYLADQGREGSTEDLAFSPKGELIMGVPGGLIAIDTSDNITDVALSGDTIVSPLGIAYDRDGNLWVADVGGNALRKVSPEGKVSTLLTEFDGEPLTPNYVAIGSDGFLYVSSHCAGSLLKVDPDSGAVVDSLAVDLATVGGPNGLAFDPGGEYLYFTTENTVLVCNDFSLGIDITAPIAGLFRVSFGEGGFGEVETIVPEVGLIGDGLAFDREDNLYVIFDRQENLALAESTVFVIPTGETELLPYISVSDYVMANLAFVQGEFDSGDLYIATIAVEGFTPPETRGVRRFRVGIAGLDLLPAPD